MSKTKDPKKILLSYSPIYFEILEKVHDKKSEICLEFSTPGEAYYEAIKWFAFFKALRDTNDIRAPLLNDLHIDLDRKAKNKYFYVHHTSARNSPSSIKTQLYNSISKSLDSI